MGQSCEVENRNFGKYGGIYWYCGSPGQRNTAFPCHCLAERFTYVIAHEGIAAEGGVLK